MCTPMLMFEEWVTDAYTLANTCTHKHRQTLVVYIHTHSNTFIYLHTCMYVIQLTHCLRMCTPMLMFEEWVTDAYTLANTCTHKHRQTLVVYIHTHSNTFIYLHTCMYVIQLTHCLRMCTQSHVWRMDDRCVHIGKHMHTQTQANTCGIYTYT